jgi:hypothetical protein
MSRIMFITSIFVFVLILGMFNSNTEHLSIPSPNDYSWGFKPKPPKEDIERRHGKRHHKRHHKWHDKNKKWYPDDEEDREGKDDEEIIHGKVIDTKVGEYQCYYVPGDDPDCQKAFKKCSIKDHPDIDKYILKSKIPPMPEMNNYILKTEIPIIEQDITEYVHKTELPDMSQFVPKNQLPDMSQFVPKNQLPNMSKYVLKDDISEMPDYIHKNDLDKHQKKCPTFPECPTCPIPEGIDIDKYMLKSECKREEKQYKLSDDNKINFGDLLPSFMKGKSQCVVNDDFRRTSYQKRC